MLIAVPLSNLTIQNRAIGGFASQLLIKPAEHDVYPFYPDLMILDVYGSNGEDQQLDQEHPRSRTTAEVLSSPTISRSGCWR